MLIEYIERLRREPKEVRQRAVFFWTVVAVSVIVFVYILFRAFSTFSNGADAEGVLAPPYESR